MKPTTPTADLVRGIWRENPVLIQLLGLCPLLAVSGTFINGLGLGLATMLTLVVSNVCVSVIRHWVRPEVRIPIFVLIIASIVTTIELAMNAWFFIGLLTMILAIGLAFIADEQMRAFRKNPENKGKLMRGGLWKYSRHPNYLGEVMTWWGLFFFSLSAGYDQWWMGAGALTVTLMFIVISIPMLEKRELERRIEYVEYKKKVGMLIPFKL